MLDATARNNEKIKSEQDEAPRTPEAVDVNAAWASAFHTM